MVKFLPNIEPKSILVQRLVAESACALTMNVVGSPMVENRRVQELLAPVDEAKRDTTVSALEVMGLLHQALLNMPPITLRDGTNALVSAYVSPEVNKDGQVAFGIDVLLQHRGHLEFTVTNTGWGKSFHPHMVQLSPKKKE